MQRRGIPEEARELITKEHWQTILKRLLKRAKIRESLDTHTNLREVITSVREYEANGNSQELSNILTEELLLLDEDAIKATMYIAQRLHADFPQVKNLSLVILGSSVNGALAIRKEMRTTHETDLDLGIIADGTFLTPDILREMSSHIKQYLEEGYEAGEWQHIAQYHVHKNMNIEVKNRSTPESEDALLAELLAITDKKAFDKSKVYLFLQPVIDAQGNVDYTYFEMLLSTLKKLSQANHTQWEFVSTLLMNEWREFHRLKDKHLNFAGSNEIDAQLSLVVETWSAEHMSVVFSHLIHQTGK